MLTLRPREVGPEHIQPMRDAGLSDADIRTVIEVCALFNTVNRLADAMDFELLDDDGRAAVSKALLRFGYA
ncbi:MAG: hypothetical protein H6739_40885 [Alphaproteobacteria bacterium]|nr:hypothetical protein [Alphaproteobacteria bacterium]